MKGKRKRDSNAEKIAWKEYPLIAPGRYLAYCAWAGRYHDRLYKRWVCLLQFDVLGEDQTRAVARVPMFLSLGVRETPHASRRGKYFVEWAKANDGPPVRGDRLSPRVFVHRIACVEIGDTTKGPAPYSVVKEILSWETGASRVAKSVSNTVKDGKGEQPAD